MSDKHVSEIDALRALAVAGVLIFHGYPDALPAGFLGVDLFFVISGYVISRVYLDALMQRQVSWGTFFHRRFRRLAPAYALVMLASVPLAVSLLEPHLLRDYGISMLAQPFYLQNVTFWMQGDYFTSALSKPLLHTWSLAVEEQFYLLFVVLIAVARLTRGRWLFNSLLATGAIASLGLAAVLMNVSPKTGFYLVPFRAWQFALGIAAWLVVSRILQHARSQPQTRLEAGRLAFSSDQRSRQASFRQALLSWLMLGALVAMISFGRFEEHAPIGYTLVLCLLSAGLLMSFDLGNHASYRWLCLPPVVALGQASYAIYLWHWPVIVYATLAVGKPLAPLQAALALIASLALGFLTWHHLENPIRRSAIGWPVLRTGVLATSTVFLIIGATLFQSRGALFLYAEPQRTWLAAAQEKSPFRCSILARLTHPGSELCAINDSEATPAILIIGDSVADQIDEMLADTARQQGFRAFLTTRNCDLNEFGVTDFCNEGVLSRVIGDMKRLNIDHVLAISNWHANARAEDFSLALRRITDYGASVTLSESMPSGDFFNPRTRAERKIERRPPLADYRTSDYLRDSAPHHAMFTELKQRFGQQVRLLSPGQAICHSAICDFDDGHRPLYFDEVHLSKTGAERVRPVYEREIARLAIISDRRHN